MTADNCSSPSDKDPATRTACKPCYDPLPVSGDEVFDLLENERRRTLIRYLDSEVANGEAVSASTIADHVAARENDTQVPNADSATRKSVYVALTSTHLDQLAAAGLVAWDNSKNEVTPKASLKQLAELLRYIDQSSHD